MDASAHPKPSALEGYDDAADSARIRQLDHTEVNRICSGQVVTQVATAIKELLENSLDAGATMVEIKLTEYGSELIEVVDNGSGIKG
jgi:DNA mismatch repair protein PMS2